MKIFIALLFIATTAFAAEDPKKGRFLIHRKLNRVTFLIN